MLEIKITIGADSSIERLADVLAKLLMKGGEAGGAASAPAAPATAAGGRADGDVDAGPLSPSGEAPLSGGAVPSPSDSAAPATAAAEPGAPEAKEVTMADMRAAVGPKLKELTERHGPEKAKEIMRAAFEAVGAKEMNTSRIPQERRAEFIKAVEGLS